MPKLTFKTMIKIRHKMVKLRKKRIRAGRWISNLKIILANNFSKVKARRKKLIFNKVLKQIKTILITKLIL